MGSDAAVLVHTGKTCNQCNDGKSIVGKRYKKTGSINIDLCEEHFSRLHDEEKANYEEEAVPDGTLTGTFLEKVLAILIIIVMVLLPTYYLTVSFIIVDCVPGVGDCHTCSSDGAACTMCKNAAVLHNGACISTSLNSTSTEVDGENGTLQDVLRDDTYNDYHFARSQPGGRALWRFQVIPLVFVGISLLASIFLVVQSASSLEKQRYAGSEAFKPGWSGWSHRRRRVRKNLLILLAGFLTPVVFLKEAFHEEQQISAGYPDGRFTSGPESTPHGDHANAFSCREDAVFNGTTDLALSKEAASTGMIAYADCECECTTNPDCGSFVFKPNVNVADALHAFARTGVCELWPPLPPPPPPLPPSVPPPPGSENSLRSGGYTYAPQQVDCAVTGGDTIVALSPGSEKTHLYKPG